MGNTLSGGTMLKNIGLIIVCNLLMYLIIILIIKIKEKRFIEVKMKKLNI